MKSFKNLSCLVLLALAATSCSGLRETDKTFVAHGETFRLFTLAIPGDDHQMALDRVPAGATITNVNGSAVDWTSVYGVLNQILSFTGTKIGGTK